MTIATNSDKLMDNTSMRSLREQRRVDWKERIFHGLFMTSAVIGILSLAIIAYFIVRESIPAFQEAGVTGIVLGQDWLPPALYGVATMIVASVVSTFGAVIVGVPVGVLTAIFIAEVAPKRVADVIRPAVELLRRYSFCGLWLLWLGDHRSADSRCL